MHDKLQVFAVVRVDSDAPALPGSTGPGVTMARFQGRTIHELSVVSVLPTMDDAIAEVVRLNALNAAKGATYFWLATRFYPQGRK